MATFVIFSLFQKLGGVLSPPLVFTVVAIISSMQGIYTRNTSIFPENVIPVFPLISVSLDLGQRFSEQIGQLMVTLYSVQRLEAFLSLQELGENDQSTRSDIEIKVEQHNDNEEDEKEQGLEEEEEEEGEVGEVDSQKEGMGSTLSGEEGGEEALQQGDDDHSGPLLRIAGDFSWKDEEGNNPPTLQSMYIYCHVDCSLLISPLSLQISIYQSSLQNCI